MIDRSLSVVTRRISSHLKTVPGISRLTEPFRRHYARIYAQRDDRWVIVNDIDKNLVFRLDRAAFMSSCIYWRGFHHVHELALLKRILKPDMVFVDVGANQGEFTTFVAKRLTSGKVVAFEPLEDMQKILEDNIKLNELTNVILVREGLSDISGNVDIFTSADTKLHHSFHEGLTTMFPTKYRDSKLGMISVRKFDDYFPQLNISKLDIIKIDVEGAELKVLAGASDMIAKYRPVVIMELNEETFKAANYTISDVLNYWKARNYSVNLISRNGTLTNAVTLHLPPLGNVACLPQ